MSTIVIKQLKEHLTILKGSGMDVLYGVPFQPFAESGISMIGTDTPCQKNPFLALRETVLGCTRCAELAETRKNVVFGAGNANAKLVFVGEAPGHDEDLQGLPFVGPAGQLLTKIIESIGLKRDEVFICNVLKCRPPNNRSPLPYEIANCEPYLLKQLDLIKSQVICALGTFAAQTLLKTSLPISNLRGRFHDFHGIKLMCTFHPAYLLRNPWDKRKVWDDMKMIRAELDQT